jgi:hypothetical protein
VQKCGDVSEPTPLDTLTMRASDDSRSRRGWFAYMSLVSVKKQPDYAAFDKNVDRKSPTFAPTQSHRVIEARKPLLFIDLCWCREGEFIFWRPNFSSAMRKFALINDFRVRRGAYFGLI